MVNQTDPAYRDSGLFSTKKIICFVKFVEINSIIISSCVCFLGGKTIFYSCRLPQSQPSALSLLCVQVSARHTEELWKAFLPSPDPTTQEIA